MANMVNVMNTILDNASAMYQERVPEATKDNIEAVGSAIMAYQATENEFLSALVNKVAMTIVRAKTFRNPLSVLKQGSVPLGKNIEEIYTNPATGKVYDPSGAGLLEREMPDTKAIYHALNRKGMYKATVSKAQLITAFTSWEAMEKLLNSIVNSIYSGDNMEEFLLMKQLFATAIEGGKMKTTDVVAPTDTATAKELVKAIKKIGLGMTVPSDSYNSYYDVNKDTDSNPVITWTPIEDQVLILRNDVSVEIDMELLAQAFNVSYAELKQRILLVDSFGTDTDTLAVLCDKSYVQVYDNLQQMESFRNPQGLYENYMFHHWQTYSLSLFANAMAFKVATE